MEHKIVSSNPTRNYQFLGVVTVSTPVQMFEDYDLDTVIEDIFWGRFLNTDQFDVFTRPDKSMT